MNKLKDLRMAAGLSQQELADKVGFHRATIVAVENGRWHPSMELMKKISKVFGKTVDEIFFSEDV